MGDQGRPQSENLAVSPGRPQGDPLGPPEGDDSTPPLYVHVGIPDDSESPVGGEDIAEVHQGIPALPLTGQEDDQGPPSAA